MIKAAFFDIDGTLLLNPEGTVPESTVRALWMLKDAGVRVVLATGRAFYELKTLPDAVREFPFDGYVMLNGQLATDGDGNTLYEHAIEGEAKEELVSLFTAGDFPVFLVDREGHFLNKVDERVERTLEEIHLPTPIVRSYEGQPIYMGGAYVHPEEEPEVLACLPHLDTTRWHDCGIDLVGEGVGKELGVAHWLEVEGIDASEAAAFGDGENDAGMVAFVGHGVAMGNGCEAVKEAADIVTAPIDEDGVLLAVEQLLAK